MLSSGSVAGAVVVTAVASVVGAPAVVVTAVISGNMTGVVGMHIRASSSVMSRISESSRVMVPSFSTRLALSCGIRAVSGVSSASTASIVPIVRVVEPLWPPLILRFRVKPPAIVASK